VNLILLQLFLGLSLSCQEGFVPAEAKTCQSDEECKLLTDNCSLISVNRTFGLKGLKLLKECKEKLTCSEIEGAYEAKCFFGQCRFKDEKQG